MNEGIQYVVMPMEILQNEQLTPSEKILYCYLTLFKKQCCFQSNAGIEKITGLQQKTITRGLKTLSELGYIFIEYVNGNNAARRIYTLLDNPRKLEYLAKAGAFNKKAPETVPEAVEQPREITKVEDLKNMRTPKRSDYATEEEFQKAFEKSRTVVI